MTNNILLEELYKKALQAHMSSDLDKALELYDEILSNDGRNYNSLHYKGVVYLQRNDYFKAIEYISKSLIINPQNSAAFSNLGLAYQKVNNFKDAINSYKLSLKFNPNLANAHYNIASIFHIQFNSQPAIYHYKKSILLNPNSIDAHMNLGNVYQDINDFKNAIKHYDICISLDPSNADALNNKANIFHSLNKFPDALKLYLDSIKLDSNNPSIYNNLGNIYRELNLLDESLKAYLNCKILDPSFEFIDGAILNLKILMCSWYNINFDINSVSNLILKGLKASSPFPLLSVIDNPSLHLHASKIWHSAKIKQHSSPQFFNLSPSCKKIRIAYFSSDFRNHAVSFLIAELFTLHNRDYFEVFGFCISNLPEDDITLSVKSSFDYFFKINNFSDQEVLKLCRQEYIDIVIDLNGWTACNRFSLFSQRLAPIQISYLGYLGSSGSEFFDYIIADKIIVPPHLQQFYTEKIIYLPNFQVNDSRRQKPSPASDKLKILIPQEYFVFCCFNNSYKITPLIFDTWINILKEVPKSILLLSGENPWAAENLLSYAQTKGINKDRILLLCRTNREEYLSRYSATHLFLDTFPYCAGTTASDSLWSGVPIVTCMGSSFASRMGASILSSIGLQELITTDLDAYQELAIKLATNRNFYSSIQDKLLLNLSTFPLFNSILFASNIDKAFMEAHRRRLNGLPTDHIFIND